MSPWRADPAMQSALSALQQRTGKTYTSLMERAVALLLAQEGIDGGGDEVARLKRERDEAEAERKRLQKEKDDECNRRNIAEHEARCVEWAEKKEREEREAFLADERARVERGEDIV